MMRRYSSCLITGALALIGLVALPVLEAAAETAVVYGASGRVGGVIVAEALARGHDVVGVYSQPDRPAGRGGRVAAPPVKSYAVEQGLSTFQPRSLRRDEGARQELASLAPDLIVVAAYGLFGFMADVALVVNMVLILGVLSFLQATLTLPGIAGIVLTIGMAVDANVLVFERIREEVRSGRTPISAVDTGYSRAFTTIMDANLTTLIAALLLYVFGSGPVRGFAVTLSIGIVTSMFTAIMLTRLLVVTWLRRTKPEVLPL